jgi:predicted RNase H-like HicB family nuclease
MYKVWYWTMVDRDSEGRFIASVPDLVDVAAYGATEKDALAHVTQLAEEHVRALVERGQAAPRASRAADMPSATRSKEFGRALIPVVISRAAVRPGATDSSAHQ